MDSRLFVCATFEENKHNTEMKKNEKMKKYDFFFKKCLTNRNQCVILLRHSASAAKQMEMRVCWNWQTGTFEGRVLHDVRVQVPSLAPE